MLNCRNCGNRINEPFLSLGNAPLSNAYLTKEQYWEEEIYFPLDVYFCNQCYLVQIGEYGSPQKIFPADYAYYSSYSESWLRHCRAYTEMIIRRLGLTKDSLVIEIGSNDGYLLQYFVERSIPVLGIDPAFKAAQTAIEKQIPTEVTFFNTRFAESLSSQSQRPNLIIGNNVLAHNPDLHDFIAGLKILLHPDGVITLEFPHLLQLLERNQFDTIYHEHFSYLSLNAVSRLFQSHGLQLYDLDVLPTHGGSVRIYVKHCEDNSKALSSRITEMLDLEEKSGLLQNDIYQQFAKKVHRLKRELLNLLIDIKNQGLKIVGYGAPAKGNTLLNYCGIRTDFLEYTVDRSPSKQNKFLPGTRIPIKAPSSIASDQPEYVLILPWNLKDEISQELSYIREWDGKFILPIPRPVVF
jgi:SAM-dependent methyltransferase